MTKALLAATIAALLLGLGSAPASASTRSHCSGVHGRLVCGGHSVIRPHHQIARFWVSRELLEFEGWGMVGAGGTLSTIGYFVDGTVVGIPAGAILGAVGLGYGTSGSFVIW